MSNHSSAPELLAQLLPEGDVAGRLRRAEIAVGALRALLDEAGPALLLVDEGGRLVFINRRAAQMLAQRDGLAVTPNGLASDSMRTTRSLRAAIANAASRVQSPRGSPLTLRMAVARRSLRPPWLLSILPIAVRNGLGRNTTGYAAIFIVECDARTRIDPLSAANYFLLTPREADVAALLAAGRNSREAATTLHIGIGTVRTHLKNLFDKTGARSQTALALRLQAFAIRD
jgi:DNA-binding CsgD family transcriptional regulator